MLKVISTSKNFKVEIYDKDQKLIYDRVRYTSMTEIGTRLSGKYFGITTDDSDIKTTMPSNLQACIYLKEMKLITIHQKNTVKKIYERRANDFIQL